MKRVLFFGLLIITIMGLAACTPLIQTGTSPEQQQQINQLTGQVNELQNNYTALEAKYQTDMAGAQTQIGELNSNLASLQSNYDALEQSYNNLLNGSSGLRNPSWAEVKAFITQDATDKILYNINTFACSGYAILIRDHARQLGFRSAYIQLEFPGSAGHVLNAFQTTDYGLVYIDCTSSDKVGYVVSGQEYGNIDANAVKTEYISCDGSPGDFWQPLVYKTAANPFSYNYYVEYKARRAFYNNTVNAYNAAVAQVNSGSSQWTAAQMDAWYENIDALILDIGETYYNSMGIVGNVETYWGDN